jgi:putative ABC transport system permease protein
MNLAVRDVRHNIGRFGLTAIGIGLLLMIVMGMGGIYQGIVEDATLLVDELDADLWLVQAETRGPFAEVSRLSPALEDRALAVPGVEKARRFATHTIQRNHRGRQMRMVVVGLAWPQDRGEWIPLIAGRSLAQGRYEFIVDESLGLAVGEELRLGRDTYTVVGVTRQMVGTGGDGLAFFTVRDAQAIQFDLSPEAVRLEREARFARAHEIDPALTQPALLERAHLPSAAIPAVGPPMVSAVLVDLVPGADLDTVRAVFDGWPDVSTYTSDEQRSLLLEGPVDRARRQIGLFRALLVIISALVMALILYTLTLDKVHDIAMLKLIGAKDRVILGLVLQEAFLLGAVGYVIAYIVGWQVYPLFPRRVIITGEMLAWLAMAVAILCLAGSVLGIWKAMRVQPNEVLS